MTKTVRVEVSGRVQGVGFRLWCAEEAVGRGLSGWVRNRRDGTVEAAIGGDAAMVEAMLDRLREGPPGSQVRDLRVTPASDELPDRFEVRETV